MFEDVNLNNSKLSIFDPNITFSWDYVGPEETDTMPYGLLTPSNVDKMIKANIKVPMIVYLHGASSARNDGGTMLKNNGIPKAILTNTSLEGFGAYILCPHIFNSNGTWPQEEIKELLDYFIKEYNVDEQNIAIMGHSLGAISAATLASQMPDYFCKAVILSGAYAPKLSIPVLWYVGNAEIDHYTSGANRAMNVYGADAVCWLACGHGTHGPAYRQDTGEFTGTGRK